MRSHADNSERKQYRCEHQPNGALNADLTRFYQIDWFRRWTIYFIIRSCFRFHFKYSSHLKSSEDKNVVNTVNQFAIWNLTFLWITLIPPRVKYMDGVCNLMNWIQWADFIRFRICEIFGSKVKENEQMSQSISAQSGDFLWVKFSKGMLLQNFLNKIQPPLVVGLIASINLPFATRNTMKHHSICYAIQSTKTLLLSCKSNRECTQNRTEMLGSSQFNIYCMRRHTRRFPSTLFLLREQSVWNVRWHLLCDKSV